MVSEDAVETDERETYIDRLAPDERARFDAQPTDPGLEREIKLLRYILDDLAQAPRANAAAITNIIMALCRTVYVHTRHTGRTSDLEADLMEAGRAALDLSRLDE